MQMYTSGRTDGRKDGGQVHNHTIYDSLQFPSSNREWQLHLLYVFIDRYLAKVGKVEECWYLLHGVRFIQMFLSCPPTPGSYECGVACLCVVVTPHIVAHHLLTSHQVLQHRIIFSTRFSEPFGPKF